MESKFCERCGKEFFRSDRYSGKQWDGRKFCSHRCGSLKRDTDLDVNICEQYNDGKSCYELAVDFGMSGKQISRVLKENGNVVDQYKIKKGGISTTEDGYLRFNKSKSNGVNSGRRLHSVVAEMKIGRRLKKNEVVHHVDRNRMNNDPKNLEVMTRAQHTKLHVGDDGRETLSDSDVLDIRIMYKEGDLTQVSIARTYGVSKSLISSLVNNKSRKQ